jgi:hypothetical protein
METRISEASGPVLDFCTYLPEATAPKLTFIGHISRPPALGESSSYRV